METVDKVYRNKAKCLKCGDVIESKSVHDFVRCSCGEIFVDGGKEYYRAGAVDFKNFYFMYEEEE
jgi:DNA-directed RNA polymerase subunit RPC12/RpoP